MRDRDQTAAVFVVKVFPHGVQNPGRKRAALFHDLVGLILKFGVDHLREERAREQVDQLFQIIQLFLLGLSWFARVV